MNRALTGLAGGAAMFFAAATGAHHSPSAYDMTSIVAFQGRISRVDWTNPHVYIYVETGEVPGGPVEWEIETDPVPILTRSGWSAETLQPGDRVSVRANPEQETARRSVRLVSIATEDGVTLTPRSSLIRRSETPQSVAGASSLAGAWELHYPDFGRFFQSLGGRTLTESAQSQRAQYEPKRDDPAARCIGYPSPTALILPYLNEIEIREDRIIISNELFAMERVIYTDGRGHPESAAPTTHGHSIGRWEEDVLVVETRGFEAHRAPYADGVPAGADRRLIERFRLSEDGTRLLIDFVLEDPEYLSGPFEGSLEWNHSPHLELLAFDCDPEEAARYTLQ